MHFQETWNFGQRDLEIHGGIRAVIVNLGGIIDGFDFRRRAVDSYFQAGEDVDRLHLGFGIQGAKVVESWIERINPLRVQQVLHRDVPMPDDLASGDLEDEKAVAELVGADRGNAEPEQSESENERNARSVDAHVRASLPACTARTWTSALRFMGRSPHPNSLATSGADNRPWSPQEPAAAQSKKELEPDVRGYALRPRCRHKQNERRQESLTQPRAPGSKNIS